jgi:opacity protein-like surface antigen
MQRRIFLACAVLMTVLAGAALAADITGNWTGSSDQFSLTFAFKQDGEKLTGAVTGPQGDPLPISDGKVQGDKVSFTVKIDMGGNSMKITHEGVIKGDEITLSTKVEGGGDFGGGGPMTLKRQK